MPLLKRTPFSLLEPPNDLEAKELLFQVRFTKEIFRDYQEYLKRMNLYRQKIWSCKVTCKSNLTYEEALVSEQLATEKVQQFPEELVGTVLQTVQYSMLTLKDLVSTITAKLQDQLVEGLELYGKKDGYVHPCRILKVVDEDTAKPHYEVAWLGEDNKINGNSVVSEDELIRKKLPFTRGVLKSFIRESTYRNLPWVIQNNLALKYGIPTDPPEELRSKISFQNGYVINSKKRKKNEELQEEKAGKSRKSKQEEGHEKAEKGDDKLEQDQIKYPIDDLMVQPSADDPVFADRPSPSRGFSIPMEYVSDLLMVWDFCSSFGRLLHLSPFSFEDFEKAICHKEGSLSLLVETHSTLLRLLIKDEGGYYTAIKKRKRKSKITLITWTEYLCDFLEMIDNPKLSASIATIKRGHYCLLDVDTKLSILSELVNQVIGVDFFKMKIDELIEERQELAATKRGEAIEDGRKRREAKKRLKAESEANGIVPGRAIDGKDPLVVPNGTHSEQNGNLVEKTSSEQELLLENGDNMHECSELKEMTKKLMEEMEKNKEQRKEFLEREMEKRIIRTNPLGKDRDYNRFWFLRRDGRVFVESSDFKQWGYYSSKEELDALIASLNPKGVRERYLKKQLEKYYHKIWLLSVLLQCDPNFAQSFPHVSWEREYKLTSGFQKRNKDAAQRTAEEEAVRRSTRVRALPRDKASQAFLKYVNKWKED